MTTHTHIYNGTVLHLAKPWKQLTPEARKEIIDAVDEFDRALRTKKREQEHRKHVHVAPMAEPDSEEQPVESGPEAQS